MNEGLGERYVVGVIVLAFALFASAERIANDATSDDFESRLFKLLLHKAKMHYQHFWPDLEFRWRVIVGSVVGFFAVIFGSLGDDRGDGIFVPMLILIIGFDPKTSTAISICMITGVSGVTVLLSHPILEHPIIDSDLALLLTPMLLLGISIGVVLNVIFAEWMVIVMLIILIIVPSTRSFFKGVEAWKEENRMHKMAARHLLPPNEYWNTKPYEEEHENEGPRIRNEEMITFIFVAINLLDYLHGHVYEGFQHTYCCTYTSTCSTAYWILNLLQVPVVVGVSAYEAVCLYNGTRVIMSSGKEVITMYMGDRVVMSSGEEVIT